MKNNYRSFKSISFTVLFCLWSVFVSAQTLQITSVGVGNGGCINNGAVTVNATGGVGTLFYSIKKTTDTEYSFTQTSNVFTQIYRGDYNVMVTDESGQIATYSSSVHVQNSNTQDMTLGLPTVTSTVTTCANGGNFSFRFDKGRSPYTLKLIDENLTEVALWNANSNSTITFSNLADGIYTVDAIDACGTHVYLQNVRIRSPYNVNGEDFEIFKWEGPVTYSTYVNSCGISMTRDRTWVYLEDVTGEALFHHGATTQMPATYPLPTRIEYPAGSGNYYPAAFNTSTTHNIPSANYLPHLNTYRIIVQNPCDPSDVASSPVYTIPYPYIFRQTTCGFAFQRQIPGYNCGTVTLTLTDKTTSTQYQIPWDGNADHSPDFNLADYGVPSGTYKVKITIANANNGAGDSYDLEELTIGANNFLDVGMIVHNPLNGCLFDLGDLQVANIPSWNTTQITYTMIANTAGITNRNPVTSASNTTLWAGLPQGIYTISISRGVDGVCGLDTVTVNLISPFSGFKVDVYPTGGYTCGTFKIAGKGWFVDKDGNVADTEQPYRVVIMTETGALLRETVAFPNGQTYIESNTDFISGNSDYLPNETYRIDFKNPVTGCTYLSKNITIPVPGPLTVDVQASGGIVCPNGFGTLHVATQGGGLNIIRYRIRPSSSTNENDYTPWQTNPDFTGLAAGEYTVEIYDGCERDANNVSLSIRDVGSQITVSGSTCQKADATLALTITSGTISNATWTTPNRGTLTGSSITLRNLTDNDAGKYVISFNSGECTWKDSVTLTVNPKPEFTLPPTTVACNPVNLTTLSTIAGTTAGLSLSYYDNNYQLVNGPAQAGTGIYHIIGLTALGCSDTSHVSITINPSATPATVTANPAVICTGQNATLTASATNVTNPVFHWYIDQTSTTPLYTGSSYNLGTMNVAATTVYTYYVSVSGDNYCENLINNRRAVTLTVNQMPTVNITASNGDPNNLCHNNTITLTANTTGSVLWYGWYEPLTGDAGGSTKFSPNWNTSNVVTYNPDQSEAGGITKVWVRVSGNVCGYVSDTISLRIMPLPTDASLTIVSQPQGLQEVCRDTSYILKLESSKSGNLEDLKLILDDIHNTGVEVKKAELMYPIDISVDNWTEINPIFSSLGQTQWYVADNLNAQDSLLVRVTVSPSCGFYSGSPLNFVLDSKSICGDSIPSIIKITNELNISQDDSLRNTYIVFSQFMDQQRNVIQKVTNNISDTIIWRLTAYFKDYNQPTDSSTEEINILMPIGLTVIPNSFDPIQNVLGREYIVSYPQGDGFNISVPVKPGLQVSDTMIAELSFVTTEALCKTYEFYAEVDYAFSLKCGEDSCSFGSTQGRENPFLTVERYQFSVNDTIIGYVKDSLWNGESRVTAVTQFYVGDTLYIDFYIDKDENGIVSPADEWVYRHIYETQDVPVGGNFIDNYVGIPFETGKQLVTSVTGNTLCYSWPMVMGTLNGVDTLCQRDTAYYYTAENMSNYKWNIILPPDAVSGATPVRIPLEGSTESNYINESVARIVWPSGGDYTLWAQYSEMIEGTSTLFEVGRTYFDVRVNWRPVLALTVAADTTICEGTAVELSHFFRDTANVPNTVISYYKKEANGSYTFLSDQSPFYVEPWDTTAYRVLAVCETSGCTALDSIDFRINVNRMPVITTIKILEQPDCGSSTGKIEVSVSGGSDSYEYRLNDETIYRDLPSTGIISNLPAGTYTVYARDKIRRGCEASSVNSVTLNPSNGGLYVQAETINANNCSSADGTIKLTVNGGAAPYRYTVNGGIYNDLPADGTIGTTFKSGSYSIRVFENNTSCFVTTDVIVGATNGINVDLLQIDAATCSADGLLRISAFNGTPPYSCRIGGEGWTSMNSNPDSLRITAGTHKIFVKDSTGCETSGIVNISNADNIAITLEGTTNSLCNDTSGAGIRFSVSGGVLPLQYSIDGGKSFSNEVNGINTISNLHSGTYQILVKDDNNCTAALGGIDLSKDPSFIKASDNHYYIYPGGIVRGNVFDDDYDLNQLPLTLKDRVNPRFAASFSIISNGNFVYESYPDFETSIDSALYAVQNTCGQVATAVLYIHFLNDTLTNQPPVAFDDYYSTCINQQ